MEETAEEVAHLDGITRDASDAFAMRSHARDRRARGRVEAPVGINRSVFDRVAALPMPTIATLGEMHWRRRRIDLRMRICTRRALAPESATPSQGWESLPPRVRVTG